MVLSWDPLSQEGQTISSFLESGFWLVSDTVVLEKMIPATRQNRDVVYSRVFLSFQPEEPFLKSGRHSFFVLFCFSQDLKRKKNIWSESTKITMKEFTVW